MTNVLYIGQVCYKQELFAGQQPALVDQATWQAVQALLEVQGRAARQGVRSRSQALLGGLLYCRPCSRAMTPAHTTKRRRHRYRYYVCTNAQKRGWAACPSKSVPAAVIEGYVLDELRALGRNPMTCRSAFGQELAIPVLEALDVLGTASIHPRQRSALAWCIP